MSFFKGIFLELERVGAVRRGPPVTKQQKQATANRATRTKRTTAMGRSNVTRSRSAVGRNTVSSTQSTTGGFSAAKTLLGQ